MIHGSLYKRISQHQRLVCKQIIDEFAHKFKWRPKGHDTIMDIGCGTGDLIADCILPILPQQFSRLVCSDISSEMISIASETVRSPKASFEILDIGVPLDESVWSEPFDHITSFYCLHWTSDQLQVMKNIYNLLSPSGDCLLTFVCSHPAFAIYHQLSKRPRWSQYMQDIHKLIPPFQFSENAAKDLDTIMHKVGFCERSVQVRDISWEFDGLDHLKSFFRAVTPFSHRFSFEDQEDFLNEFAEVMKNKRSDPVSGLISSTYSIFVVFARKQT